MIERTATIRNAAGIHCRPSAVIMKAVQDYRGEISVAHGDEVCAPLTAMGLLQLELHQGANIRVTVTGEGEAAMCDRLVELFETRFDFPPRT